MEQHFLEILINETEYINFKLIIKFIKLLKDGKIKIIKEIGSGAFLVVLKAERLSDGTIVAIKKMK